MLYSKKEVAFRDYKKEKACVEIRSYNEKAAVEIKNKDSLTVYSGGNVVDFDHYYKYYVYYNGNQIMQLWSCVELDDAFFDLLFENIVTTNVKN